MWAQGRFASMVEFARAARRLGFANVEINYTVGPQGLEELLACGLVRFPSLHAPTPRVQVRDGRWSESLNLASLDEEERALAVELGRRTLEQAARAGARYVVFHLGGIGDARPLREAEEALRRLYREGVREGEEVEALRRRCRELRALAVPPHLERARRSLAELAETAARLGVAIGLENRYHYHEIPGIDEMAELLAPYPPGLVGYWHDMGHAEVLDRLGLVPGHRWLQELGQRCLGAHIHDVDGVIDHRAPGRGDADWEHIARYLPREAPRVLEINQRVPEEEIAAALPFLRQRGVLP